MNEECKIGNLSSGWVDATYIVLRTGVVKVIYINTVKDVCPSG